MTKEENSKIGYEYIPKINTAVVYKETEKKKIYFSSRYRPDIEAKRLLSGHENEYNGILFLIGGGNLCLLELICETLEFEILVVIEPDEEVISVIRKVCTGRILPEQQAKIHFFDKDGWEGQIVVLFERYPYHRARIFVNRAQAQLDPEKINYIREQVSQAYNRKMINANTLSRFEKVWLRNLTKNTKTIGITPGIEALFGVMKNVPGVIIGAGPSLGKHLEILRKNQNQMCLIAVDTVTKALHNNGIFPHIVVVIDPQKVNARYVENLDPKSIEKTIFICEPAICGSALRAKEKKLVIFDTLFPYYEYLTKFFLAKGDLDLGGSVANAAYDVAIKLGFSKVSLVGLDMCYAQDSYHVRGCMYEEHWYSGATRLAPYESLRQRVLDLPDMQKSKGLLGDVVYLDSKFLMFINWFVERQKNKKHTTEFYNCTEGGYPIEGIPNIAFEEFIRFKINSQQFEGRWEEVTKKVREETEKQIEIFPLKWESLKNALKRIRDQIWDYQEIAKRGKFLVQQTLGTLGKQNQGDLENKLRKLNQIDAELIKNFEGKEFINMALQKVINQVMKETGEAISAQQTLENSRMIYEEIITTCTSTIRYLNTIFV